MGADLTDSALSESILIPVGLNKLIEKLPQGLDTSITEDGKNISGGERQKIALARALVRKSQILLLDEPLTHLDPDSSAAFLRILDQVGKHKTIIITGHGEAYQSLTNCREINLDNYAGKDSVDL